MSGHLAHRLAEAPRPVPPEVGVADPDPSVRDGLCALLETCGFRVRCYENADELPDSDLPPCLVLDLDFPGLTPAGLEERIRATRPDTRVIVTASCPDATRVVEVLRAGAAGVLEKPFPPERLIGLVEEIVSRAMRTAPGPRRDL